MAKVLIAGCGDVGIRLAKRLIVDDHEVWGLRRDTSKLPPAIIPVTADLRAPESLRLTAVFDYLFYLPSADARSDDAYRGAYVDGVRNLLGALQRGIGLPTKRIFYVSSTGVYSQNDGGWVDENSPTLPAADTGRRLLDGERTAASAGHPCTIVRFAGIYGPGRSGLINRVKAGAPCTADPPLYTNRIHSDDCAGVLHHLMRMMQPRDIYIGVDDEPALQCEVMDWIAGRLDIAPPRRAGKRESNRSSSANKRCSNRRLAESGFRFSYPTFRQGYAELLCQASS